jgi:succinate-semialdehyde dehydrogenase/glutarate-semialdehyde dehydrogenase
MTLAREEIFGPIAAVYPVGSTDEAVAMANDTDRGLAAYVFSEDLREGAGCCGLESGIVGINRGLVNDAAAPFGGVKTSRLGREGGPDTLHEYRRSSTSH